MADTLAVAAPAEEEAEETKKGGKLKLIIIAVVAIALGGVAAKMFLLSPAPVDEGPPPPPEEGAVVTIGQMTTSLAGEGNSYARVELAAVTNAEADATMLEEKFPLMRDEALTVLMGFSAQQLKTVEGADQLRAALSERAQEVWDEEEVLRIVLTDLLVQ